MQYIHWKSHKIHRFNEILCRDGYCDVPCVIIAADSTQNAANQKIDGEKSAIHFGSYTQIVNVPKPLLFALTFVKLNFVLPNMTLFFFASICGCDCIFNETKKSIHTLESL